MTTINLTTSANGDDVHAQTGTNDAGKRPNLGLITDDAILSPGSHGNNDEYSAAVRFTGVTIAQAATISSATFSWRANATYNASPGVVKYWVCCQAADNAGALSTSGSTDLDGATRAGTTADSTWTVTSVTGGTRYSVDITTAVQEVINRAGWASGNAIVVLVDTHADTTQGEWQDWDAYNTGGSTNGPKLDITYTAGGGGSTQNLTVDGGITPTGAMARRANVVKAGGMTPVGALVKVASLVRAGGATPSGALVKVVSKVLAGALSTITGALVNSALRLLTVAGGITPAGALVKTVSLVRAGGITPAGALVKLVSAIKAGGITPSGVLVKTASKVFSGALSSLVGALINTSTRFVALAGGLTPSGALVKQAGKVLAGGITPSGVMVKLVSTAKAGGITPSGVLVRTARKVWAGALTLAGAVTTTLLPGGVVVVRNWVWQVGAPLAKWVATGPVGAWLADSPMGKWRPGPPRS